MLASETAQVKEYYTRVAEHYRIENLGVVSLTDQDVEKFVYRAILKDKANSEFWKQVGTMPAEQIAHVAGKEVAQFLLSDGAFRIAKGTVQIVRLQGQIAAHGLKTGVRELAAVAAEKTAQAANRIAQALPKAGESVEVAIAGTEGVFKTTIKNPGVAEACESIAKNPPKMEMVKDAVAREIIKVNNMTEFFKTNFGRSIEKFLQKTNIRYDGQTIYRAAENINGDLKKGYHLYLDGLHKDHLEVFDRNGTFRKVLNLDGTTNYTKTNAVLDKGRSITKLL